MSFVLTFFTSIECIFLKLGNSGFRIEPIFATVPAASKTDACFKSGQKWLENNLSFVQIRCQFHQQKRACFSYERHFGSFF